MQLDSRFFNQDASKLAIKLLGKIIRRKLNGHWLAAHIIETEAYYRHEKASHSSLGYTTSRKALFMPAGTIYMYYAHGHASLNVSAHGQGNAVLIKSAHYYHDKFCAADDLKIMQALNPLADGRIRSADKICSGQTLLCRSLNLQVSDWNLQQFDSQQFYFDDTGYTPEDIVQTTRLGIPEGRDGHLLQRYVDAGYARYCTKNPLTQKSAIYKMIKPITL